MRLALHGCLLVAGLALAPGARAQDVKVESVEVRVSAMGPALLLRVGQRAVPVMIDPTVAQSVQGALEGRKPVRPLTHDLMHAVLGAYDGKVSQVVVTLKDGVFHGALTVVLGGTTRVFDARSSDAIALAIHAGAPILLSRETLEEAGIRLE